MQDLVRHTVPHMQAKAAGPPLYEWNSTLGIFILFLSSSTLSSPQANLTTWSAASFPHEARSDQQRYRQTWKKGEKVYAPVPCPQNTGNFLDFSVAICSRGRNISLDTCSPSVGPWARCRPTLGSFDGSGTYPDKQAMPAKERSVVRPVQRAITAPWEKPPMTSRLEGTAGVSSSSLEIKSDKLLTDLRMPGSSATRSSKDEE